MTTACNKQPPPEHPMHGSGVACHMAEGHDGPCAWDPEPSKARRAIDRLLSAFPAREVEAIDSQPPHPVKATDLQTGEVTEMTMLPAGPWVLVRFVGGGEFAIWKATGDVYQVGLDGAVGEDPIINE